MDYSKTLTSPPGMFTSLEQIQAYIELPATRTTEARSNYEGKVIFKHYQIRLVASNEPLMRCGPLPDWLRDKCCTYAIDAFDDNLCVWRCLVIYKRHACGEKNQVQKRNCMAALNLARECYGDSKLK